MIGGRRYGEGLARGLILRLSCVRDADGRQDEDREQGRTAHATNDMREQRHASV
jgi:hypothetical protein